jgi:hypothetical protein
LLVGRSWGSIGLLLRSSIAGLGLLGGLWYAIVALWFLGFGGFRSFGGTVTGLGLLAFGSTVRLLRLFVRLLGGFIGLSWWGVGRSWGIVLR